ncbi:hypothetical protein PG985_006408 [Apiospora marii]|uniref:Uncharacterized protein n=1 Tax=Apiospora marii TaxID=335849 RepID=A0ABR1S7I2_9PEZI
MSGTPLTYPSPPTPSAIPGNAACYGWPTGGTCPYPPTRKRWPAPDAALWAQARRQAVAAADCPAPSIPAFLTTATSYPASRLSSACSCALASASPPTTTTTCTAIGATWPQITIPAFCQPSFHANRASLLPLPGITSTAVATLGVVSDKLDCCVSCAGIFNCVAWSYVPFPSPTSTNAAPTTATDNKKINPWISGMCVAVYNYGIIAPSSDGDDDNAAAVCPNGVVGEALGGASGNPSAGGQFRWENLYYNGWNEGPCGRPLNVFQSGQDGGRGDYDTLCR